jgi:hypothetical protein
MADVQHINQLPAFTADFSEGPIGLGGGVPDEGLYPVTATAIGFLPPKDQGPPTLTVTYTGCGDGDRYDYIKIPTHATDDADGKKLRAYKRLFHRFLTAFGMIRADEKASYQLNGEWLSSIVGKAGHIFYVPPLRDEGGNIAKNSEEITHVLPTEVEGIKAGEIKITRRRSAPVSAASALGAPAYAPPSAAAPPAPGAPSAMPPGASAPSGPPAAQAPPGAPAAAPAPQGPPPGAAPGGANGAPAPWAPR